MTPNQLLYYIAIGLIPGIGCTLAKRLIAYCGSAEAVFREKKLILQKIPGIGEILAREIVYQKVLSIAEQELAFIEKEQISAICYTDDNYPERLRQCEDGPIVLFVKGNIYPKYPKILSVVGTRNATPYGTEWCETIISQLSEQGYAPLIISGLAYGIDICAHRAALKNNLPTIAVMATGLDKIYPALHRATAAKIVEQNGALVTDFLSKTEPDRQNFLRRNRIIAGLADATLVVESGEKGGALVTAEMAISYNRDVLALPGRINDIYSRGCNILIRNNKAALVETISDIEYALGWESVAQSKQEKQLSFFIPQNEEEQLVVDALKKVDAENIDILSYATKISMSRLSALLFHLEMNGVVKSLPGKRYMLK